MDAVVEFAVRRLRDEADPGKALAMAAYMKTDMPFYGVQSPQLRVVQRDLVARFPVRTRAEYHKLVLALWRLEHREEKYLAIGVARSYPRFITLSSVPLYRRLILGGAWWDLVDGVAIKLAGRVLLNQRGGMRRHMDAWIDHRDLWLRRTALIAQVDHRRDTDRVMLFDFCLRRAHEKEFFIRKAIGWALREYAKSDPAGVREFALENRDRLSGLSFREATKHLNV